MRALPAILFANSNTPAEAKASSLRPAHQSLVSAGGSTPGAGLPAASALVWPAGNGRASTTALERR